MSFPDSVCPSINFNNPPYNKLLPTCWFSGFLSLAGNLEVYKRSWFKPLLHEEDGQPQRKLSHSKNRLPMNLYNYYGTWQTPKHAFHYTVQWRIWMEEIEISHSAPQVFLT